MWNLGKKNKENTVDMRSEKIAEEKEQRNYRIYQVTHHVNSARRIAGLKSDVDVDVIKELYGKCNRCLNGINGGHGLSPECNECIHLNCTGRKDNWWPKKEITDNENGN